MGVRTKVVPFRIGERVGYKSVIKDAEYNHAGKVQDVFPDGLPSCPEPMLYISGKAGVVLASHCTSLEALVDEAVKEQAGRPLECREASPMSASAYIPCAKPAERFVLSERGRKVYPMCRGCADHNTKNRRALDLGPVVDKETV